MKHVQYLTAGTTLAALACAGYFGIQGAVRSAHAADSPATIELTGVVRDFKEKGKPGGHVDFEITPSGGFAHYSGSVATQLGSDGKPVFVTGGFKVDTQWKTSAGKPICYSLYDSSKGDSKGKKGAASTGGITSAESFQSWFHDVPGTNMSKTVAITLVKDASGSYVFDATTDPLYKTLGGFFPVENELFGNPGGSPNRNFHFTYELQTEFTYDSAGNQVFEFRGDDDVWVFINNKLVIDLGGVHGAVNQFVELNRLGLENGKTYNLAFFFAERHRTQSNFKMTTNLKLKTVELPTVTAAFD
jgi:fibro-slime domain-containing protein